IERRDPHDPLWLGYAQFVRTFLLPLAMNKQLGLSLESILLPRRDGIEPEEVFRACRLIDKLRPPLLTLATLPTLLGSCRASVHGQQHRTRRFENPEQARFVVERIIAGLRRHLSRVKPIQERPSRWSDYAQANESYSDSQLEQKSAFVG